MISQSDSSASALKHAGVLEVREVTKYFGELCVLDNVDLEVHEGESVVLMGPSGSGKSTLLRTINRLESIDEGTICLEGEEIAKGKEPIRERQASATRLRIGMVFQQFNLFHHMTALDNVAAGPRFALNEPVRTAADRARDLLASVGLQGKENHYPAQLSGGQQQRVAIARALAMEPQLLLFDEPTSALDPEMVREVIEVMSGLVERGTTMLVVSHEMAFAKHAASRIIFMEDGRLIEDSAPQAFFSSPSSPRAVSFLERFLS